LHVNKEFAMHTMGFPKMYTPIGYNKSINKDDKKQGGIVNV